MAPPEVSVSRQQIRRGDVIDAGGAVLVDHARWFHGPAAALWHVVRRRTELWSPRSVYTAVLGPMLVHPELAGLRVSARRCR